VKGDRGYTAFDTVDHLVAAQLTGQFVKTRFEQYANNVKKHRLCCVCKMSDFFFNIHMGMSQNNGAETAGTSQPFEPDFQAGYSTESTQNVFIFKFCIT
jgi:hypothetical protein